MAESDPSTRDVFRDLPRESLKKETLLFGAQILFWKIMLKVAVGGKGCYPYRYGRKFYMWGDAILIGMTENFTCKVSGSGWEGVAGI